mmetsp:Transcript_27072/g.23923  ORF Transcript_27072/g.23923 Transcript_27072/m.23923 type:complete len:81 (+) Transcript_27072:571-813(+)
MDIILKGCERVTDSIVFQNCIIGFTNQFSSDGFKATSLDFMGSGLKSGWKDKNDKFDQLIDAFIKIDGFTHNLKSLNLSK